MALAQIGVFVEFREPCDMADRKNNVLDPRAAGIETGTDVLTNLFDLRLQVAFPDNIADLVTRHLTTDDDQMATVVVGRQSRGGLVLA